MKDRGQRRADTRKYQKKQERLYEAFYHDAKTASQRNLWKNISWKDCGCEMCKNPRHSEWLSNAERLTISERKALDEYRVELEEVAEEGVDLPPRV